MNEQGTSVEAQQTTHYGEKRNNALAIPIAIVFGFGLIALAIFFGGNKQGGTAVDLESALKDAEGNEQEVARGPIRPIDESDHIKGNPNAPIVILEYSDFDCPFCKQFHETMNTVMEKYGTDGKVAWVYRHFPIEQRHPNAPFVAQASECVAQLGGNEAFWKFSDLAFGERGTNDPTDLTRINEFAVSSGVSETAFKSCLESNSTQEAVKEDLADGINAGVRGTPHSLFLFAGQQAPMNGARPYEYVDKVLETLIAQMEGKQAQ